MATKPQPKQAARQNYDHDYHEHHNTTHRALAHITKLLEKLMSKFTDFVSAQTAFNTAIGADIDAIAASSTATADSVTALVGDVKNLNDQIAALVAAQGDFTPEQQAAVDALVAQGTDLQTRADGVAAAAKATADAAAALDAQTPPVVPPAP